MKICEIFVENDEFEYDELHKEAGAATGTWGAQGAGCIILAQDTGRFLLGLRSTSVMEPHTYGGFGGAIDPGENPLESVKREVVEETGYTGTVKVEPMFVFEKGTFRYSNFLVIVEKEFKPVFNWEHDGFEWCELGQWPQPLHYGLKALFADQASMTIMQTAVKESGKSIALVEKYSSDTNAFLHYMKDDSFDPYGQWYEVCEWIENNDLLDSISPPDGEEITSADDLREYEPELFYQLSPEDQKDCSQYVLNDVMRNNPADAPTTSHMSLNRKNLLARTTWLVHFTDEPDSVANKGFKIGVDQMDRLGLTTYIDKNSHDKINGGFNFAFLANGRHAVWAASQKKYGEHAVMFQNSGVSCFHYGDEEDQVVFHGTDVDPRDIIVLIRQDGDWRVMSHFETKRGDHVLYSPKNGGFENCVQWVEKHFDQYRRYLTRR